MEKIKKPFYKKWWFFGIIVFVIMGIIYSPSEEEKAAEEEAKAAEVAAMKVAETKKIEAEKKAELQEEKEKAELREKLLEDAEKRVEEEKPNTAEQAKPEIDTSIFGYAKKIDVTDARDINDHITLIIDMKTENQGMAFQHALNQTYDFLQQSDVNGTKTIGINVLVKGNMVGMFTVYPEKFKPNDDEPMSDAVMKASEIEFMTDEVKEFGKIMGSW